MFLFLFVVFLCVGVVRVFLICFLFLFFIVFRRRYRLLPFALFRHHFCEPSVHSLIPAQ